MEKNAKITTQKLVEEIGLSIKGIEWNIRLLKKEKKLQRIGGRKEGYWKILK